VLKIEPNIAKQTDVIHFTHIQTFPENS